MKDGRKATLEEIKVWYKLKPELDIWLSQSKGKTGIHKLPDETWYGGYWFNTGLFIFIQFRFFALHVRLSWWRIKLGI
ncbi:hypothetical protein Nekkels2_63 [Cellulophaga phage Nekkels_2]|nr:hypothetical protein Nekkels2_63 [Cellulophaga phage Nekkels_2]